LNDFAFADTLQQSKLAARDEFIADQSGRVASSTSSVTATRMC
jgi:hypothetical protein